MGMQGRLAVVMVWAAVVTAVGVPIAVQRWMELSEPTSLKEAVWRGDFDAVARAGAGEIERANDRDWPLLMTAVQFGQARVAELLIVRGADVNAQSAGGQAALTVAAGNGHEGMVRNLLAHGADISLVTTVGKDALAVAAGAGQAGCVRLLLEAGGDPFRRCYDGETALGAAVEQGNWGCVWEIVAYRFRVGAVGCEVTGRRAR